MRRPARSLVAVAAASVLLAACTSSPASAPSSTTVTDTATSTRADAPTGPLAVGPTTAARAASCPYVTQDFVRNTIGMRLGRVSVLHAGGRTVGCRIYALQGSALSQSEHLPGPNQPAVEITTSRYASATAAHNAFVRTAEKGTNLQQATLRPGIVGVCFQTDFYPRDKGTDWACAFNHGSTAVLVRTVDNSLALDVIAVAKAVLRAL